MKLMARDRSEKEGRFGSRRMDLELPATAFGYGGIVLERLARHTCRIAQVDWSCIFVRDRNDPHEWRGLVATIEDALRLRCHQAGTLAGLDRYLHQRTGE